MAVARFGVLLFSFVLACSSRMSAQQQTSIPPNVDAGLVSADVRTLLRMSGTFRAQCERIAADPRAHVRVTIAYSLEPGTRAQTTVHRYRSGALVAEVEMLFGGNYRELLAHEFEHVIEQIEGVDLREEATQGTAWMVGAGAFETRRARLAGVQVLEESTMLRAAALPYTSRTSSR